MLIWKKPNHPKSKPKSKWPHFFFSNCHLSSKRRRIMVSTESIFQYFCLKLFYHDSCSMFGHYLEKKIRWNNHRETCLKNKDHLILLELLTLDSLGCSPKLSKLHDNIQLWSLKLTLRSQQSFDFTILLSHSQKKQTNGEVFFLRSNTTGPI